MSPYFPVSLDLRGRRCVVVGAGSVAARKIDALLGAGAENVIVVAPEVSPEIAEHTQAARLELRRRPFAASDLDAAFLVMAATDDSALNHEVASAARARGVLVNVVDDPDYCDFILPAVVRRGDLALAVTTGGGSPAFARFMRELLEDVVTPEYGWLLDISAALRLEARQGGKQVSPEAWQRALRGPALGYLQRGDVDRAARAVREALGLEAGSGPSAGAQHDGRVRGSIILVGAGPGDPGLLTLAGRDAIAGADVIFYDRLVNSRLLDLAPDSARLIYAGKGPDEDGPLTQDQINEAMCAEALAGRQVIRLKGGDPFVFGRGGEEARAAITAGVPFTLIPGVSAAIAVPAYAGIPVTHRGLSSAFTVITGQQGPTGPPVDWPAVKRLGGTLVLLMGVETLPVISGELLRAGLPAGTPAAVIEHGTWPDQRVVLGTLEDIATRALALGIQPPATTVIGAVAALADELAWFKDLAATSRPAT